MGRRRSHSRPAAVSMGEPSSGRYRWPPKSPSPTLTSRKRKRSPSAGTSSTSRKRESPQAGPIGDVGYYELKDYELVYFLLETPSGFAMFSMYGYHFKSPDALEDIWQYFGEDYRTKDVVWLEEFKTFKDKSSAINHDTGVNRELADMIMGCCYPWQKLAVGNLEYKRIIETNLPISCLFDEIVMEVMWGLKNLMHILVPEEKLKLRKEDRLPMSQGLKRLLNRYGFDVKPSMVNEKIIVVSYVLHDADFCEKKFSSILHEGCPYLQEVSGINSEDWDLMKLATALKIICDPPGTTTADKEFFTEDELSILLMDAHKYEGKIAKRDSLFVYQKMVDIRFYRARAQTAMVFLVEDAERAYEAKRRAAKKLSVKLVKEAERAAKRRPAKKLSVKLGQWPIKYWIPWFQRSPKQSRFATVNG